MLVVFDRIYGSGVLLSLCLLVGLGCCLVLHRLYSDLILLFLCSLFGLRIFVGFYVQDCMLWFCGFDELLFRLRWFCLLGLFVHIRTTFARLFRIYLV